MMSTAKRVLFVALSFLLLITAIGWGYWTYRQYLASQTPIPREATSVVRIHVDGLIRDIAWNALWNRAHYRDTTEKPSSAFDLTQWKQLGIPIPANLFLYQVNHRLSNAFPGVYFGSLAVDDSTRFTAWLHDNLGMEIRSGEYGTVALSDRALVIVQSKRALLALSPTKAKADLALLTDVLTTVLQAYGGNVALSKSQFAEIMRDDGQVSGRGIHPFTIDFRKGLVAFSGQYEMDNIPDRPENMPGFADSNAVSLWVQGGLAGFLSGRQFEIGGHTLHGDSLLRHYNGHAAAIWNGAVTQQDTIVNFDYNDDFELVEVQEIVDKSVPEIYCSLHADTALIGYLRAQGVIEAPGNTVNRDVFPLFRLDVSPLPPDHVQFHTAEEARPLPASSGRNSALLYLRADFNKLYRPDWPAGLLPYIQAVDLLELSGQPASGNHVAIHGTLRMKNLRLHSLVQLLTVR